MPPRTLPHLIAVLVCAALAAAAGWTFFVLVRVAEAAWPETREVALSARVVPALEGTVVARRRGRVRRAVCAPGDEVAAGDALIEFDDLALFESRADLEREIDQVRAALAAASERRPPVESESVRLLRAALRHLEESYGMEREEFERWKTLKEEGLVARIDFERKEAEFAAVTRRLEEARAGAEESPPAPSDRTGEPDALDLRRSERLLARLNRLPDTFFVRSPWNGAVQAIHVVEGDIPERRAPLAIISRTALGRLEAELGRDLRIVEVRSACGIPGPFPFTLRDGVLSMIAPSVRMGLGQRCRVAVLVRPHSVARGN